MFKKIIETLKTPALTTAQVKQHYQLPPSLCAYLPWVEYSASQQCFLLHDRTVAAVFELEDLPCEARPAAYLQQLRQNLQGIYQDVFPLYRDEQSPWIVQCYVQHDLSLAALQKQVTAYMETQSQHDDAFSLAYQQLLTQHCDWLTQSQGIFFDDSVSGRCFRGGQRRIRLVIYRRFSPKMANRQGQTALQDLQAVATTFTAKLQSLNIAYRRYTGQDFYNWLVRWFNPKPLAFEGDVDALLRQVPYPEEAAQRPFGHDLSEQVFFSSPRSNEAEGVWYFDELPHRYMSIPSLSRVPYIGHLTAERPFGSYRDGLFDRLPPHSVFVMTTVMQDQEMVKQHLERIEETARKSHSTAAQLTFEDCQVAKAALETGNYLFPTQLGIYLCSENLEALAQQENEVEALLLNHGFHVLDRGYDLLAIDSYLNQLPMCYNYQFDKQHGYRSSYVFAKQLANLLPLYGRARGTGHPGTIFFNRGGEPLTFDPLNPEDKDNNSFLLLLGAAGAGKSSTSNYLLMQMMAMHRPRLVIADAGDSYRLLLDYFKSQGLSTYHVAIHPNNPPILNPFADSEKMLAQLDQLPQANNKQKYDHIDQQLQAEHDSANAVETASDSTTAEARDYMGEMALACQLMITGGEQKEYDKLTRQDRMLILDALVLAAQTAKQAGKTQMIASDVVAGLETLATRLETANREHDKQQRLREMADSLSYFCKDALSRKIFNQPSTPWVDADIILFEQGIFKDEGYETHNALAFMGLMSRVMARSEKNQYEARQTIFHTDEAHTILRNPLMAVYLTKCAKMARKLGLWLWLATQNLSDFAQDARKILSMIEFWIGLGLSEAEIKQVEQFRALTAEEKQLFRSARKAHRKYVEGVLMSAKLTTLFRNIPPRLCLALAMTEKHEKAERQRLMKKHGMSEIEAAMKVAEEMIKSSN